MSVVRTHREGESNEKCGVIIEGFEGQMTAPQGRRYNPGFFVLKTKMVVRGDSLRMTAIFRPFLTPSPPLNAK